MNINCCEYEKNSSLKLLEVVFFNFSKLLLSRSSSLLVLFCLNMGRLTMAARVGHILNYQIMLSVGKPNWDSLGMIEFRWSICI